MQHVISPVALSRAVAPLPHRPLTRAIAVGGAVVGVLDAVDGVAYFGLTAGWNPIQVLQFIASGALGPAAFEGGLATAALGAVMHFALAYAFTAAFLLLRARSSLVRRADLVAGLAWGAGVWALMNLVALPLSRVAAPPIALGSLIHGVVGHALFVGLAAALVARKIDRQDVVVKKE